MSYILEGSANCSLHLSPSLVLGSKLYELLTCLTHTPPMRGKRPIMSLLLGYSLGLFFQNDHGIDRCMIFRRWWGWYGASKHAISECSKGLWEKTQQQRKSDPFKSLAFFRRCGRVSRFWRLENFRISCSSEIISRGFGRFYTYFCWHQTSFVPSEYNQNPDPSFMAAKGAKFVNLPNPVGSICSRVVGTGSWDDCQGAWVHRCHGTDLGAQKVAFWLPLIWGKSSLVKYFNLARMFAVPCGPWIWDVAGRMFVKAVRDIWYATLADIWSVIWCMIY